VKDINITLQIITLVVLIGGIYTLDKAGSAREGQMMLWLKDAELEREEYKDEANVKMGKQLDRIRSMETFLYKYTPYKQFR
jgi:hypothetical protein